MPPPTLNIALSPARWTKPKVLLSALDIVLALQVLLIVLIKASKQGIELVTNGGCGGQ